MFYKNRSIKIIASVLAAFLVLPTAAQGIFAAADKQITVIVEMKSEPLFSLNGVDEISDAQQQRYSEKTQTERDKVLSRAEKAVGSLEVEYVYNDVFNGAAVTVRESELKELENVYGVARVYEPAKIKLATDDIDDAKLEEFNRRAKEMIDLAAAREPGYEGEGTLIAIIDGGFEPSHENFQKIDKADNKLSRDDVVNAVRSGSLSSTKITSSAYFNSKIPYTYSYALESNNGEPLTTAEPDHGTHVAGIAAGNGDKVEGVAPAAQLALMQIAWESNEAYVHDVVAAINDAVILGADAMIMSFGENWIDPAFEAYEPMTKAIDNARNAGVFVAVAAGNEGYLVAETKDPYYATDCFPSTAPGATSVGAANSNVFSTMSNASFSFGGKAYEIFTAEDGIARSGNYALSEPLMGGTIAAGLTLAFHGKDYAGTFVPILKGTRFYQADRLMDQLNKLYEKDAVACLISQSLFDEITYQFYTYAFFGLIPPVLVLDDADFNAAISAGSVTVTEGFPDGMAYFSTWGFDRDLENGVDIAAPGTEVYSSITDNGYDYFGGTSMATPCVCGASALMSESINRSGIKLWGGERIKYIENAMKNTAVPYADQNGAYLSPRVQGAGLMNIGAALKNQTVLTDALRSGEAEIHLGTALGDKFSFSFKLMNRSNVDKVFSLSASFTTDSFEEYEDEDKIIHYYIAPEDRTPLNASITGLEKPVTVKAGDSVILDVFVALDPEQTAALQNTFTNGFYVDGFIVAESGGETLSIPATGFYGDYYDLPAVIDLRTSCWAEDDSVFMQVYAAATVSLRQAEVIITDEKGGTIWRREYADLEYNPWFYLEFSNEEEDVPILGLSEGNYHVTLNVLPASKGAKTQTYEDEFYFPGFHDPEILSWELIPEESDGNYTVRAVSARNDLDTAEFNGVTLRSSWASSTAWLELEEETEEGFVFVGSVYISTSAAGSVKRIKDSFDVTFTNVVGRSQLFKAPVSEFQRNVVRFAERAFNFFVDLVLQFIIDLIE